MKKFLTVLLLILLILGGLDLLYYYSGELYVPVSHSPIIFSKAENKQLYLDSGSGLEPFEIKGVNLGMGKPGYFATDFAVTKEEYLRWFQEIKDMGANVIRTYILAKPVFYEAFYEFNCNNPDPLYLIHGIWVDDYLINSSYSALDDNFYYPFVNSCKDVVDAIHGRFKNNDSYQIVPDVYRYDISPWVYGYILGVEWESTLVGYTDQSFDQLPQFEGKYFYTENASNFEIFLASIGEDVVSYETEKYGTQRVLAFSNWATTDPMEYSETIRKYHKKYASIDVEHIKCSKAFEPGQFASYHVYPYYPDYCQLMVDHEDNTYLQYLQTLTAHHTMPVVISEFGIPTSRGCAAHEEMKRRNQGFMSEKSQGNALVSLYKDIETSGCAGGIVFSWQDEWFKRTWNTMAYVDLSETPYWSDVQTNEQYFGLLSFDPGKEKSICYVDGDFSEWNEEDTVVSQNDCKLSMKYDERYLYFLIQKNGYQFGSSPLYLTLDVTPKSGAFLAENYNVSMDSPTDFLVVFDGAMNSRVLVQERYDRFHAVQENVILIHNTFWNKIPPVDSTKFVPILMQLTSLRYFETQTGEDGNPHYVRPLTIHEYQKTNYHHHEVPDSYETGLLRMGNGNPYCAEFDSLADFCKGDGFIELRLPWQLLNFADPSTMKIHDDYYENYGVEYLSVDHITVGVGDGSNTIHMEDFPLKPLGRHPVYHERLKRSYYILQDYWNSNP